jgi:transposase-like protein
MKQQAGQILKVDEAGRRWTPRELREAVLDEFERSGMAGTQFARQVGVKYPTFASWVQQRRKTREGRKQLAWMEATVEAPQAPASTALRVVLPGGARMEIADEAQARLAAELLRVLAQGEGKEGAQC